MNLLKIVVKNSFAHKNTTVEFQKGLNVIVGSNGKGKSELLDMIAYALFGTSGLRSAFKDYDKDLYVELLFVVNNVKYVVIRDGKDSLHSINSNNLATTLAVSKSAVNKKIVEIIGYGLDVYNKINYSKQLESTSHSLATKTSRVDLINKVNGIDEAVMVEKYYDELRKSLNSELKGLSLSANPVTFIEEEKFENIDISIVVKELKELREFNDKNTPIVSMYSSITSNKGSIHNLEEIESFFNTPVGTYLDKKYLPEEYLTNIKEFLNKVKNVNKHLTESQRLIARDSFLSKETNELITEYEVSQLEKDLEHNIQYKQKTDLLSKGNITCPHCSEMFPLMTDALAKYEHIDEPVDLDYTETEIKYARMFVDKVRDDLIDRIKQYEQDLEESKTFPDLKELEDHVNSFTKKFNEYKLKKQELDVYLGIVKSFEEQYGSFTSQRIEELSNTINSNSVKITELSTFVNEYNSYVATKNAAKVYQEAQERIGEEIKSRIKDKEAYEELIKISKDIKLSIQNTCIPSLNRKASVIVSRLTENAFHSLCLSDTFELHLNDKPINVYAGSVQVIANIAFRIAIIELFYKKKFPVFIGDEIDSFADNLRADTMHNILANLSNDGYQVLLISHHPLNVQANIIDLNILNK